MKQKENKQKNISFSEFKHRFLIQKRIYLENSRPSHWF